MRNIANRIAGIAILVQAVFAFAGQAREIHAADTVSVKLGTLAPRGSSYHDALIEMGQKWRDASAGAVKLTIYPDGMGSGEADMVRSLRADVLQAGMITVVGLYDIEPSVGGLSYLPLAFHSWDEYDYVVSRLTPRLEKMLLDKGYVVLFWADAGIVRFFSKTPGTHPDDFKSMKLWTWAGNAFQLDLMKSLGYDPIPLETVDILPGLQRGQITAVPTSPQAALIYQIYTVARNMLDLKWSMLAGAAVIKKGIWDRIAPETKNKMLAAAAAAGARIRAASRKEDNDSIAEMQKRGLKVNPATPQVEEEWQKLTKTLYPQIRGKMVPGDIFDEVQRLSGEYRASQKGAGK